MAGCSGLFFPFVRPSLYSLFGSDGNRRWSEMDLDGGSDNTIGRERDEDKHAARQDGLARRRRPHPRDIGRTGGAHSALNRHKVEEGHKGHSSLTEPTSCQYKFPQGPEARKRASIFFFSLGCVSSVSSASLSLRGELTLRRDKLIRIPVYEDIILFPVGRVFPAALLARKPGRD